MKTKRHTFICLLIILLLAVNTTGISGCKKEYPTATGWVPLPSGFVPLPREVDERLTRYEYDSLGEPYYYSFAHLFLPNHASGRNYSEIYVSIMTDEVYPLDTVLYKKVMDSTAIDLFDLLFFDQTDNKPFLNHYKFSVFKTFKIRPGQQYREHLKSTYNLNDSLFVR